MSAGGERLLQSHGGLPCLNRPSLGFQGIHLAGEVCIWQPAGGPAVPLPDDVRTVLQELEGTNDLTPSVVPEVLQP